jgi:hypothetical protein
VIYKKAGVFAANGGLYLRTNPAIFEKNEKKNGMIEKKLYKKRESILLVY